MGKSRTRNHKNSGQSNQNSGRTSTSKSNATIGYQKFKRGKKRKINQMTESLQKVIQQYRSSSQNTSRSSSETTIITLDTPSKKRRLSATSLDVISKRRKADDTNNLIVIHDDSIVMTKEKSCSAPVTPRKTPSLQCSTPKAQIPQPDFIPKPVDFFKSNNNSLAAKNFNEEVNDLTNEINGESFVTIDLTTETLNSSIISKQTVIDLENTTDNNDCTVVSISNANLSMSGDSDVTVLNVSNKKKDKQMNKFVRRIANMNSSDKGKLLDLITQNIFSGCNVTNKAKETRSNRGISICKQAPETAEDTYIKEVILGQSHSRNSIGSNIYNPERDVKNKTGLRMVVIDGSNVAMEHGRGKFFSVKGLRICIDYFLKRGHVVKAFVPRFRCKFGKSSDPRLLDDMERRGLVVYTPSREIQGRMVTSYDDRYIVQCAAEFEGVIVSGDNYRDLLQENPRWRFVIENRLLPFTWVDDMIMFPKDPLGRSGPTLDAFLRHPSDSNQNTQKGQK